jgi:hypothetical protein
MDKTIIAEVVKRSCRTNRTYVANTLAFSGIFFAGNRHFSSRHGVCYQFNTSFWLSWCCNFFGNAMVAATL